MTLIQSIVDEVSLLPKAKSAVGKYSSAVTIFIDDSYGKEVFLQAQLVYQLQLSLSNPIW